MATVVKDFKIKSGLVVEGTTGTINNFDILTKKEADQTYITNLVGGTGTAENTANTLVKRDASGNFAAGDITVDELSIGSLGRIYKDDNDDLVIANIFDTDIEINANDLRLSATDDIRLEADDFVGITSLNGIIEFEAPNGDVFINGDAPEDKVVVKGTVDSLIGDNTVDGTTGNTITDRIASASQDLTDHENATEAHGATGAVVGTTNEQTLTNKTISYTDNTLTVQVANVSDLTATASELNVLDGITASTSELNILDGVTATASELNLLDGVTATTAELNYVDGVTSSIQNQLDDKAPLESPALTGTPTAPTAAAGTNSTQVATTAYADAAVAALVDGAPELLNTLNELAAALDDNPDVISDLQDIAAGKQDELTAGANIDITGATISVTGLDTDDVAEGSNQYFLDTRAVDAISAALGDGIEYVGGAFDVQVGSGLEIGGGTGNEVVIDRDTVDTWYDANGAAAQALSDAEDYADGLAGNYEAAGTAQGLIDLLDTDDIEEGTNNLYYLTSRAKADAAALLTSATLENLTITGDGDGLTITAENGVADSDTDDLTEGTTNLYFTDERAVDALQGTDSMFSTVSIDEVALQVAASLSAETAGVQTAYDWAHASYRSAEFLVKVAYGTHTEISKVLLTLDTSDNIAITEYGIVGTNGSASSISAAISGTDVQLLVTTTNNNSTVTVVGTLLA
jgi:hypothetical protein